MEEVRRSEEYLAVCVIGHVQHTDHLREDENAVPIGLQPCEQLVQ